METISVAINDRSDVRCLDLYLINIFTKSTKAERCTDIMFKQTLYCLSVALKIQIYNEDRYEDINILGTSYFVLLNANLGARQAHDTSVRLIFPAL